MSIRLGELLTLAEEVELRIAKLYDDMVPCLAQHPEAQAFFCELGDQERSHAEWVRAMKAKGDPDFEIVSLEPDDFQIMLTTIDDVHDEVLNQCVNVTAALEIVLHIENSTGEDFYLNFPPDIPGLPNEDVERLVQSCMTHAQKVVDFRSKCIEAGRAGVHMPETR